MFAPSPGSRAGMSLKRIERDLSAMMDHVFGNAQGDILYRDATAWKVLAPGTSGQFLKTTGPGGNPQWATGSGSGGGLFNATLSATPTQSSTGFSSWLNHPASSTVANGNNGVVVYEPSQSAAYTGALLEQAAPATPYSFKALIANVNAGMVADEGSNYPYGQTFLGFSDGTKLVGFYLYYDPNTGDAPEGMRLYVGEFSNYSSGTGSVVWGPIHCPANPIWVKIVDDGTNLKFSISFDGDSYLQVYSQADAAYLSSPSKVVFGAVAYDANTYATLMSWTQGTS